MKRTLFGSLAVILCIVPAHAQFSDTFDSGTDSAWTHWTPQTGVSQSQSFNFPASTQGGLGYQLVSSNNTATPSAYVRVGSYVTGLSIPDFTATVDLIDWDNTKGQSMGIWARLGTPISASAVLPNGYGFAYVNRYSSGNGGTDQLRIYRLDTLSLLNVDATSTKNGSVGQLIGPGANPTFNGGSSAPVPSHDYELKFWGVGPNLYGQMIDLTTGLPLLVSDGLGGTTDTIHAIDSTYTTGSAGLWALTQSSGTVINPTFDNFDIVPEPSALALAGLGLLGLAAGNIRRSRAV